VHGLSLYACGESNGKERRKERRRTFTYRAVMLHFGPPLHIRKGDERTERKVSRRKEIHHDTSME
jgi:hypothetical protein